MLKQGKKLKNRCFDKLAKKFTSLKSYILGYNPKFSILLTQKGVTMLEHIYARKGTLYIQTKIEGKRLRLSTGLKDCALSVEFIQQNFKLFLQNKAKALQKYYELYRNPITKLSALNQTNIINRLLKPKNEFENVLSSLFKEKQMLKYRTAQGYKSVFKDILDFINLKELNNLKDFQRQDSVDFINFLQAKNNANLTIRKKARTFKAFFNYAIELDLIDKNPFFMPKLAQSEQELESAEIKPFDLSQMQRLIKESKGELKSYLTIAFFTGLRTGELLGLKKDDLNLSERKAHIRRTLLPDNKGTTSPKNRSSYRIIDLLPLVAKELKAISYQNNEGFLFKSPACRLRKDFKALQERLQIQPLRRLYDTRHSFASVMLSKGEEPMWISRVMLGHSSLNQTFKTYAKYLPKSVEERATFLNGMEF